MNTMNLPVGSIESYIQSVRDIPLLTPEEEYRYATQYREQGDLEAAQKLVLAHLRYVVRVARGYLGYGLALNDLVQEGTIGLMKAVKRYDPTVGVRLVSFAVHWVKAEIHEFILKHWRIVKVATTKAQRKLFFNLRAATKRLGWNSQADIEDIAKDLGVSTVEVRRMEERLNARDVSFDLPLEAYEHEGTGRALVPVEYLDAGNDPYLQIAQQASSEHKGHQLQAALETLDPRSRDILQKRWLSEEKCQTLQALAEVYQISIERVRQLEKAALQKLKAHMLKAAA
jgi:RNA polymerase sigma-32 factor